MRLRDHLVIVQRYQHNLFKILRHSYRGAGDVIVDRRHGERRKGAGVFDRVERRQGERRRPMSVDDLARWAELRHVIRVVA